MSPRKTRRGTKFDSVNETMSETISKKMGDESFAATPGIRRTRRQAMKTNSLESDADQSLDTNNKSNKKIVPTSPSVKTSRLRKKPALESTVNESYVEADMPTRRSRRGKENESITEQKTRLDNANTEDSEINKSRGIRARKKVVKKMNSNSEDESAEVAFNEKTNVDTVKNVTIDEDAMKNDDAVPMSIEDAEVHRVSDKISRLRAVAAVSGKRRRGIAKLPIEECTPESSPITVNLTPHRTTKTPRKSPMNLDSPKSHAETSLRLSKTPRKLPIVAESPAPSEKSIASSPDGTPVKSPKIVTSDSPKIHRSPKSPKKKFVSTRKFSKSPKIILRSPKRKSSKVKSPRVVASKAKKISISKGFLKSPIRSNETSEANASMSDSVKKSLSPKNIGDSMNSRKKSPGTPMSVNLSRIDAPTSVSKSPNASRNLQSPTVLLDKMPVETLNMPVTITITRSRKNTPIDDSTRITPTKSQSAEKRSSQGAESPRGPKSVGKKRGPITDSGTPLRPIDTPTGSAVKRSPRKSMILSSSRTPVANSGRGKSGSGLLHSSTPRDRVRRPFDLSVDFGTPNLEKTDINIPANVPTPVGSSTMINESRGKRRSLRIENESNPLIVSQSDNSPGSETRLNGTYEVEAKVIVEKEDEKPANGTYELAEPKTPNLRKRAAKRSIGEMDESNEERAVKRTCRVRFASSPPDDNEKKAVATVIGKLRSATPGNPSGINRFGGNRRGSASETIANNDKFRRRSNSMTNASLSRTPMSKRRSNSVTDSNAATSAKKAQNASVNRLSKPRFSITLSGKKQEVKTPIARKAPNFAEIHQKKFAKMESLVDAKKRLEKRHIAAMTTSQIPTSLAKTPKDVAPSKPTVSANSTTPRTAVNGAYNRYGFKLRKNDAVKIMTQKQAPIKSDKKQNENRMLLKGVRTNRRFELIMKARNINL